MKIKEIKDLLKTDEYMALALATESQIDKLIENKTLDEDYSSYYQEVQEEMRCLMAEC